VASGINSRSELTNIDEKACNNIPEAVNKLAFSARLGHSCEINMTPFIILSKFQRYLHRILLAANFLSYDIESARKNAFTGFAD
jgi:hypothetical protein